MLIIGIWLNFEQFFVEQWMRFSLRNEYIVLSFSTTPHRINNMEATISTFLKQNAPIKKIYLSIPYVFKRQNIEYVIPEWLQNNTQITILRSDDYGPATKLLGALKLGNLPANAIIITVDDDITYPKNLVLHLAYKAKQNPGSAVGISGADPDYDANGIIPDSSKRGLRLVDASDINAHVLQGFAGIAYRKSFFQEDIFEINNAPRECINSDDVYISHYLARYNIPRIVLRNKFISSRSINYDNKIGLQEDALHKQHPGETYRHRTCLSYLKQTNPEVKF